MKNINMVNEYFIEAESAWKHFFENAEEDFRFYLSKQWSMEDAQAALEKQVPTLNLNYIKKNIDQISGHERQNRSAITIYPIEGADESTAEIYSSVIKWITKDRLTEMAVSGAFKDALICGIGWLALSMDYSKDILNGDLEIRKESPFNMLIDPGTTQLDLSDCSYITRQGRVHKDQLKLMYANKSTEIENTTGGIDDDDILKYPDIPEDRGERLKVVELWRREYKNKTFIVNTQNPSDVQEWEGDKDMLQMVIQERPELISITKKVPQIKLTVIIEDKIEAYHGDNPYETETYPFHPVFGYFESSFDDWNIKLQGLVSPLKDAQREKNKRRSQIMQILNTTASSGWIADRGAVDDIESINSGGAAKYIEKNPGKTLERIQPPTFPASVMQLEMAFSEDIKLIGVSAELLGNRETSRESGVAVELRQRQGLIGHQELFDNLSTAKVGLGRQMIELINKNFTREKMQRIVGEELQIPPEFDENRDSMRFDVVVDETADSPTYKLATLQALLQYQQYGGQVDPETIIELSNIPKSTKDKMLQRMQAAQQQALAAQQPKPTQGRPQ